MNRLGSFALALGLTLAGVTATRVAAAFGDKVQYDITLPGGFEHQMQASPGQGVEATRFAGKKRPDGTRPVLLVTTVRLPPDNQKRDDDGLRDMLVEKHAGDLSAKYKVDDYTRENTKLGSIPAVKLAWESSLGEPPRVMKVALVIAVVNRVAIIVRAEDLGEKRREGVRDMERAISSFSLGRR
jgi:hypothetical protein